MRVPCWLRGLGGQVVDIIVARFWALCFCDAPGILLKPKP